VSVYIVKAKAEFNSTVHSRSFSESWNLLFIRIFTFFINAYIMAFVLVSGNFYYGLRSIILELDLFAHVKSRSETVAILVPALSFCIDDERLKGPSWLYGGSCFAFRLLHTGFHRRLLKLLIYSFKFSVRLKTISLLIGLSHYFLPLSFNTLITVIYWRLSALFFLWRAQHASYTTCSQHCATCCPPVTLLSGFWNCNIGISWKDSYVIRSMESVWHTTQIS
jgi:hypothetical protein